MGFSTAAVTSWPTTTLPGSSITLRANADAGVVFVVGTDNNGAGGTDTFGGFVLPAVFRPLASLSLTDVLGAVSLSITPAGSLSITGMAAGTTYFWRSFYLTTVTPG